ncbi:MAG: hypothetical protein M1834_005313 [Cirrosporium novae-zelandiae]|nr:MAG: hypothetical protein M1834_005313 [Cirrosporium novae-zelandiae]
MRHSTVLYTVFLLPLLSNAHMQMSWPYPIRSPLNPNDHSGFRDYDYASPLKPDGSNYPCKGYQHDDSMVPVTIYKAGSTYNMTIAGRATHKGGSCQLSLSYDDGKTFKVIKSMVGGCPSSKKEYRFTVPAFAPQGNALFAWTWFNKVGNREMYMDCTKVKIEDPYPTVGQAGLGLKSERRSERMKRHEIFRRAAQFHALPNIFVANIGSAGADCKTMEDYDVIFPHPGSSVEYDKNNLKRNTDTVDRVGYACPPRFEKSGISGMSPDQVFREPVVKVRPVMATGSPSSANSTSTKGSILAPYPISANNSTNATYPTNGPTANINASLIGHSNTTTITVNQTLTATKVITLVTAAPSELPVGLPTGFLDSLITAVPTGVLSTGFPTGMIKPALATPEACIGYLEGGYRGPVIPGSTGARRQMYYFPNCTIPFTPATIIASAPSFPTSTASAGTCVLDAIFCNTPSTWSRCGPVTEDLTDYIFMGPVEAGTECVNGTMQPAKDMSCDEDDGTIICSLDGKSFYVCVAGGKIGEAKVAQGSICKDGEITRVPS